ncbi:MAG: hypothetical protein KGJ80_02525 [Chloroflexota bacterium]|nr:hypothetical protein [Chloroflexota bacterium]
MEPESPTGGTAWIFSFPNLRREVMTMEELQRALRKHDLDWDEVSRIEHAQLELDGTVTVHLKETGGK